MIRRFLAIISKGKKKLLQILDRGMQQPLLSSEYYFATDRR